MNKEVIQNTTDFMGIARCYSLVFRDKPWEESFKDNSGNYYSSNYDLTWRQNGFTRAYPLKETSQYIEKEVNRPGGILLVNLKARRVIAFGWGYLVPTVDTLISEKWKDARPQDKETLFQNISANTTSRPFWYLSEVGVLNSNRNKGIASEIVTQMIANVPSDQDIVMRTNASSPMTIIAKKFEFDQILGPRNTRQNGCIVISKSENVNGLDPVNSERVLYVLQRERRLA